ncbi:hypothetical protein H1R20_g2940, partial [Candolleomyces eurysporus]
MCILPAYLADEDAEWLDRAGNIIDEQHVVNILEGAEDYNAAFQALSAADRVIAQRLRELGENMPSVPAKPQECSHNGKMDSGNSKEKNSAKGEPPKFEKKENVMVAQWIEVLDWYYANGKSQVETASHFDPIYPNLQIKQPLVSSWLKEEEKWHAQWAQANHNSDRTSKHVCLVKQPEVTKMLELWTTTALADGLVLTGEVLRQKYNLCEVADASHGKCQGIFDWNQQKTAAGVMAADAGSTVLARIDPLYYLSQKCLGINLCRWLEYQKGNGSS